MPFDEATLIGVGAALEAQLAAAQQECAALIKAAQAHPNITLVPHMAAVDLITHRHVLHERLRHFHRCHDVEAIYGHPVVEIGTAELAEVETELGEFSFAHRAGRIDQHVDRRAAQFERRAIHGRVIGDVETTRHDLRRMTSGEFAQRRGAGLRHL